MLCPLKMGEQMLYVWRKPKHCHRRKARPHNAQGFRFRRKQWLWWFCHDEPLSFAEYKSECFAQNDGRRTASKKPCGDKRSNREKEESCCPPCFRPHYWCCSILEKMHKRYCDNASAIMSSVEANRQAYEMGKPSSSSLCSLRSIWKLWCWYISEIEKKYERTAPNTSGLSAWCYHIKIIRERRCAWLRRRGTTCGLKEKAHSGNIVTCRCNVPRHELSARKHARHKYRRWCGHWL